MSYCKEPAKLGGEYERFYPGVYSAEDKTLLEQAIESRLAINNLPQPSADDLVNERLPKDTPGLSRSGHPPEVKIGEATVIKAEENALVAKFNDVDNPLWTDREYARSLGYADTPAFPLSYTISGNWGQALPDGLRDTLAVNGLNRVHYFYKPVYPGDKLYGLDSRCDLVELTPEEGNEYRTFQMSCEGAVYNQNGELVGASKGFVKESLKRYKKLPEGYDARSFEDSWDSADWWARPARVYSDGDWAFLREQWAKESRRGAEPLYWEDVKVGEYIAPKYVGPITVDELDNRYLAINDKEYHMTIREKLADPEIAAKLYRDPADGIYYDGPEHEMLSNVQPGFNFVDRQILENSVCPHFVVSMIYNWMGDRGWIYKFAWDIMGIFPGYEGLLPDHPNEPKYLQRVPGYENFRPSTHGLISDVCVCKGYIHNKYIKNGERFVDLTWWCETLDGDIFQEGMASVKLPGINS